VTLRGPAASEQEKQNIEKQVSGMKGVRGVHNQLTAGGRNVTDKPIDPLVPRGPGNQ
jgi:osmotically-inducible protein OsmY